MSCRFVEIHRPSDAAVGGEVVLPDWRCPPPSVVSFLPGKERPMQVLRRSAIVVGGGIGGLAAAIGLRRAGWTVLVLEQAPVISEVGAGWSQAPNAIRAFDALGVGT
jgi:NADPH-dependent 2,4-dienoyl-CoA reductase/sulfur reductase-like enzyme